ncbi:hypothetical protein TIFTF001_004628 [Ficus carica]|uniref:Uncharacterized protein n=1 Tax=Ficus carica TaxID=3494 RepID=A0AA87ZI90_FICCA|nr:hypothetical protein TIFTF001_004628 [Ficus carica]
MPDPQFVSGPCSDTNSSPSTKPHFDLDIDLGWGQDCNRIQSLGQGSRSTLRKSLPLWEFGAIAVDVISVASSRAFMYVALCVFLVSQIVRSMLWQKWALANELCSSVN